MSKKRIPISCLGPRAQAQLRAEGYDVDKFLRKEQAAACRKTGVGMSPEFLTKREHKFGISAKDMRTMDGIVFDSKLEMSAYRMLRDRGIKFDRQVEFTIQEGFYTPAPERKHVRPIKYVADFRIYTPAGNFIVDTKGMITPDCKLKLKIMLAQGNPVHCISNLGALSQFLVERGCRFAMAA